MVAGPFIDSIREDEIARLRRRRGHLRPEDLEAISLAARTMVNTISPPLLAGIKGYANRGNVQARLNAVGELPGLEHA